MSQDIQYICMVLNYFHIFVLHVFKLKHFVLKLTHFTYVFTLKKIIIKIRARNLTVVYMLY